MKSISGCESQVLELECAKMIYVIILGRERYFAVAFAVKVFPADIVSGEILVNGNWGEIHIFLAAHSAVNGLRSNIVDKLVNAGQLLCEHSDIIRIIALSFSHYHSCK